MPVKLTAGVVIATRNRRRSLVRALEHWERSIRQPDQVVIVDASPDAEESRETVMSSVPSIFQRGESRYLVAERPSSAGQRNTGIDSLWTDVAAFGDDDSLVHPDYLQRVMDVFEKDNEERIGGVQGVNDTWGERPRMFLRDLTRPVRRLNARIFLTLRQAYPRGVSVPASLYLSCFPLWRSYYLWGACMNFRTALVRSRRFDENMRSYAFVEDFDLSYRIGRTHALVTRLNAKIFHAVEEQGRVDNRQFFLLSWLNPAYVIEKNVPQARNRRPLLRKLRQERRLSSLNRSGRDPELYDVAERMVRTLQEAPSERLVETYLRLQSEILSPRRPTSKE